MPHCSVCAARVWDGARVCPACGAALERAEPVAADAAVALLGRRMGDKFVLRELIGTGATGHVFRADQTTLGRTVAVKVLREHLANDPEVVRRFHDEALAASRLNHPNTVAVIDYGQTDDGRLYIVMEYLRGRTLTQILRTEPRMPLSRALALVSQVLDALEEAHAAGVVHADLKSDNIMVEPLRTGSDLVKVVDFGIARIMEPQHVSRGSGASDNQEEDPRAICGTPEYMAPEVILGAELTGAADQYGAAVVLFELLAGVTPFAGGSTLDVLTRQLREPPPLLAARRPDLEIPAALAHAVTRALAKNPADRYAGVAEFRAALQASLASGVAPAPISSNEVVLRICPACSARNPSRFKFCPECGERIDGLLAETPGGSVVLPADPRTETFRWAPPQPALFPLPLVGRGPALAAAETFLAGAGAATTLLIAAPLGAGASRLVEERTTRVSDSGVSVIVAGPDPSGLAQTFYPLRAAVAAVLDLPEVHPFDVLAERLEAAGLSHRDAPGLAELLGQEGALSQLDPTIRRRECFAATLRVLRAAAWRGGRAALVFEDVDEFDPMSIELLRRLAEHPIDAPVRVLLTSRPTGAARWQGEHVLRVDLPVLTAAQVAEIADHLQKAQSGASPSAAQLLAASQGEPLHLEHAVRYFFEGGSLESAPESLPDLIASRLARLPASVRVVLQAAAVLGREAPRFALQRVIADEGVDEADLGPALGLLATHGMIEHDGELVRFSHPLVRDVAYDAMPADVRRALHRAYAETLPAHVTPTAILGTHAEHASLHDVAVVRLLAAGDEAERRLDDAGAAKMYQRALASARRGLGSGDGSGEPTDRMRDMLTAAIKLAEALRLCGDFTLARGVLEEAGLLCDGSHRALEAQLKRAQAHLALAVGAPERALAPVREAIGLAMTTGSLELLAALYLDVATVHARRADPEEAARELLEGIDFVTVGEGVKARSGPRSLWRMATRLAELQLTTGRRREAIVTAQHALRHALRAHSAVGRGRVNTLLAQLYEQDGDLLSAERHRAAAIEEMRLLGDRRTTAELLMAAAATGQLRVNFEGLEEAQILAAEVGWEGLGQLRGSQIGSSS